MEPVAIAVLNQKGGVGKTSTCVSIAGALAYEGRRVLLIDNDPQASMSRGFFGPNAVANLPREATLAAIYDDTPSITPASLIVETGIAGLDIVPTSRRHFEPYNFNPPDRAPYDFRRLRQFVSEISEYEVILIDCPPNLYFCSWAALMAADYVIVPTPPEEYGAQGLSDTNEMIVEARHYNPTLRLLGYLITMYERDGATHRLYRAGFREAFGDLLFENVVPRSKHFPAAYHERKPLSHYRTLSGAGRAMFTLAHEVLGRIERIRSESHERDVAHG